MRDPLVGIKFFWAVFTAQGDDTFLFQAPKTFNQDMDDHHLVLKFKVTDTHLTDDDDHVRVKNDDSGKVLIMDGVMSARGEMDYKRGQTVLIQFNEVKTEFNFVMGTVSIERR